MFVCVSAVLDFDPSPLEATFMPDLGVACVDIPIVKDQLVGESKEMFGALMAVQAASSGVQVAVGSRGLSTVIINDIPGSFLCVCVCVCEWVVCSP